MECTEYTLRLSQPSFALYYAVNTPIKPDENVRSDPHAYNYYTRGSNKNAFQQDAYHPLWWPPIYVSACGGTPEGGKGRVTPIGYPASQKGHGTRDTLSPHLADRHTPVKTLPTISTFSELGLVTGRNEVVAKVMFLLMCVILFTGGSAPGPGGVSLTDPPADTPLWADSPPPSDNKWSVHILLECILVHTESLPCSHLTSAFASNF